MDLVYTPAMRRTMLAAVLLFGVAGCGYHEPLAPTVPVVTVNDATPATLTLGTVIGQGVDAGHSTILARVQNGHGVNLPNVTVQFTTDTGALSATSGVTGVDGLTSVIVTAPTTATITSSVGSLVAHVSVISAPPLPPPTPSVPPVLLPPPTPVPTPAPAPPPAPVLSLVLTCVPATHGGPAPTSCNLTTTYGSTLILSTAVSGVAWDWGDGTAGPGGVSIAPVNTHGYAASGTYTVTATETATTTDGAKTATTNKQIIVP